MVDVYHCIREDAVGVWKRFNRAGHELTTKVEGPLVLFDDQGEVIWQQEADKSKRIVEAAIPHLGQ
jgi:hypothetical protein